MELDQENDLEHQVSNYINQISNVSDLQAPKAK